jgi:hypothetical protein
MADSVLGLRGFSWRAGMLSAILLLCHAIQASGLEQEIDPSAQRLFHVHGVVLNALTNKPIGRVLVTAMDAATMTDSDGRFEFDLRVSTGNIPGFMSKANMRGGGAIGGISIGVMARRPGFLGGYQPPILVLPDKSVDPPEVEIKLTPESILKGSVTAPMATAPIGVQVMLLRKQIQDGVSNWVPGWNAFTNSRGEYRIADLQAGDYKVMTAEWRPNGSSISVPGGQITGYPPVYYPNEATPIHIAAGETVEADLDLRPVPYYRVRIPITVSARTGMNVEVKDQSRSSVFSLGFNQQSQMIEGFLPNGTYSVRVTSFGPVPSRGVGSIEVAGGPIEGARISLTPGGVIPVIVREEYTAADDGGTSPAVAADRGGNRPSRLINLMLQSDQGNESAASLRPQPEKGDDVLVIENVWEGKYRLYVMPSRGYVASATANGVDLLRNLLTVGASRTSAPIEITLRDDTASLDGTLSGNAATEGGQNTDQKRLFVNCIPLNNELGGQVRSAVVVDGKFSVQNLSPGRYLVVVFRNFHPNIEYRNDEVLKQYESNGTTVTLEPGQKAVITLSKIIEDQE